jgi:hypothetical protein
MCRENDAEVVHDSGRSDCCADNEAATDARADDEAFDAQSVVGDIARAAVLGGIGCVGCCVDVMSYTIKLSGTQTHGGIFVRDTKLLENSQSREHKRLKDELLGESATLPAVCDGVVDRRVDICRVHLFDVLQPGAGNKRTLV